MELTMIVTMVQIYGTAALMLSAAGIAMHKAFMCVLRGENWQAARIMALWCPLNWLISRLLIL